MRRAFGWILGLTVCLALVAVALPARLVQGLRDASSARSGQGFPSTELAVLWGRL